MSEVTETKQFFENHQIQFSDFWLESCINWFHQEVGQASYTKKELHTRVYEQWLLLDLRDVEVPQLPPNVNSETKVVINKIMALQMMSAVDISKPKFGQIQKIKNLNTLTRGFEDEKEVGSTPKRMLQLTLTDGQQEIKAIEYKPIPSLNINLVPGMKIKIIGPVTVRRGQMMLEQQNVKLLGGEVEEILVSHAAENILARYLNLPENPNPNVVDEALLNGDETLNEDNRTINFNTKKNESRTETSKVINQNLRQSQLINYSNTSRNQTSVQSNNDISEEEELRIAAEVEMLLEVEHDILRKDTGNNRLEMFPETESDIQYQSPHTNEVDDLKMESEIEMLLEAENDILRENLEREKKAERTNLHTPNGFDVSDNKSSLNSSLELEGDVFNSVEMDKHLNTIEEKYHTSPKIAMKELLENIQNDRYGKYKVYAKFKSVIQKMTVKNDKWSVEICITDGQDELAVYVHNDIVSKMTGLSPKDAMDLRKDIETNNQVATQRIMKALDQFKDKLLTLDCIMEVEFAKDNTSLMITELPTY